MKIMAINNVYQYVDLIARCQCVKCTSFCTSNEVHNENNCVFGEGDKISFELLIFPP